MLLDQASSRQIMTIIPTYNLSKSSELEKNSVTSATIFTEESQTLTTKLPQNDLTTFRNLLFETTFDNVVQTKNEQKVITDNSISTTKKFPFSTPIVIEETENSFTNKSELINSTLDAEENSSSSIILNTFTIPVTTSLTSTKPSVSTWLPTFPSNIECKQSTNLGKTNGFNITNVLHRHFR